MPLSDHEQRVLDAIEQELASEARVWEQRLHRTTWARVVCRKVSAALLFSLGLAAMAGAVDFGPQRIGAMLTVCIIAYLAMFAALLVLVRRRRVITGCRNRHRRTA
jgi:ABC-type transport system involved in cytochrome bd biosynthesis fused ATPase/permease subunit